MSRKFLRTKAPAKVNLSLHIVGRRPDFYHALASLVVFARIADQLSLDLSCPPGLQVTGPMAEASGKLEDNLVLRAARHLAEGIENLESGAFKLEKYLPVAAGLGGGSADAAAALRLLAAANHIPLEDVRLIEAARRTGADVPVCLHGSACIMRGIGDQLGARLPLAPIPALLVNPRAIVETAPVFKALGLQPQPFEDQESEADLGYAEDQVRLFSKLTAARNDLEAPAIQVAPIIADVIAALRDLNAVKLARMSGSGATCFALFSTKEAAFQGAQTLQRQHPGWWIEATEFGQADIAIERL